MIPLAPNLTTRRGRNQKPIAQKNALLKSKGTVQKAPKIDTLRFKLYQMIVKSAFLNGYLNEEVYIA